jgi:hypothetical protein
MPLLDLFNMEIETPPSRGVYPAVVKKPMSGMYFNDIARDGSSPQMAPYFLIFLLQQQRQPAH